MSQNDFVIANASGSAVRSDMNSAFQALASLSGGDAAPSTTYAGQIWFDTINNIVKIRDEANTAWINLWSVSGSTLIPYRSGTLQGTMSILDHAAIAQDLVMTAKQIKPARASVASAANVDLGAAAGNVITLTGVATITGFTMPDGGLYLVHYTGAGLTLTHNATTLVCPTAANIAVATNDTFIVEGKAANQAVIVGYQRASGAALAGAVTMATQAEQVTGSSITVATSPGRQHFHEAAVKAWTAVDNVNFSGTSINQNSYGVSSTADTANGVFTVNFTNAFDSAYYGMGGLAQRNAANDDMHLAIRNGTAPTASACAIGCRNDTVANENSKFNCVMFAGTLA